MSASVRAWGTTLLVLLLSGCAGLRMENPAAVTLTASSDLTSVPAGSTVVFDVEGLNFTVATGVATLEPETAGSGPTLQVDAMSVTKVGLATSRVTFQVPDDVNLTGPTPYLLSFSGTGDKGEKFASSNKLHCTLMPGPHINAVSPAAGRPGDSRTVNLTGVLTHFDQQAAQASFGAGISVGGAAEGDFGPTSASSATQLSAQLHVNPSAALGPRDVTVKSGGHNLVLHGGFAVVANRAPSAVAGGPYTGAVNAAVQFSSNGSSDPDGDPITFSWTFGDGNTGAGAAPAHAYTSAGIFTVTLTVTDDHGGASTATTTATVSAPPPPQNHPPTAVAGGPYSGVVGQPVSFDGSASSDPDNDPLAYTWSFGDGGAGNGAKPAHTYSAPGSFTVSLTVDDGHGATSMATTTATISVSSQANVPGVTITAPAPLTLFNHSPITVTGTADPTVTALAVNGIAASLANGSFTAQGVPLREGSNILTATALDAAGNVGTASVTVVLDTTPPAVHIDSPSDGAVLNTQQVTVTGMVNDIVTGTVNSAQASVVVNGVTATISNRSFVANGVLLLPGRNTLAAVARDRAGNESRTQIQVTLQDASVRQRIIILSGNNQTSMIGTVLPQPLTVQAVDGDGAPLANRQLTFTVRRSDGILQSFPDKGQQLRLVTDQQGKASVLFQLGTRVGAGINQVAVTAPGFVGEVIFSASTTAGAPAQIVTASGENQHGIVGAPLPHPFSAAVFDSDGNPLEGVPVKFEVQAGGGSVDGAPTVTRNTDSDGIASVVLTLGMQEGISNQVVTASCDGCGTPASLTASSVVAGPAADTQVSGVVLDNADQPVPNATASIVGTQLSAISDAQGRFTIKPAPVGTVTLLVDGRTSSRPETFPFLAFQIVTLPGQDNTIGGPIYLPPLDLQSARVVGGDQEVVLTMKDMPGVAFTVFPHSATFPDGSKVGKLMLTQVHSDKVPMPPPNATTPRVVWTLQPAGVQFNPPIRIQLPNLGGLSPGQVIEAFQFDHDLEQWASVGMSRVSPDGSVIVSDPGFGISKAGWGHIPPPPAPTTTACGCGDTGNVCKPNICAGNKCVAIPAAGAPCDDKDACTVNDRCDSGGGCHGAPITFNNLTVSAVDSKGNLTSKLLKGVASGAQPAANVTFKVTANTNCPSPVYEWDFGDGGPVLLGGAAPTQMHSYTDTKTYMINVDAFCNVQTKICAQAQATPAQVSIFKVQITDPPEELLPAQNIYYITGDDPPKMPSDLNAKAKIVGIDPDPTSSAKFDWTFQTLFNRNLCPRSDHKLFGKDSGTDLYSPNPDTETTQGGSFAPKFSKGETPFIAGGPVQLKVKVTMGTETADADSKDRNPASIWGTNPAPSDVRKELGDNDVLKRIACVESGGTLKQFDDSGNGKSPCPLISSDGEGLGIMQITTDTPTIDQAWSWLANVTQGIAIFEGSKANPTGGAVRKARDYPASVQASSKFATLVADYNTTVRAGKAPLTSVTVPSFTSAGFDADVATLAATGQIELDAARCYNGCPQVSSGSNNLPGGPGILHEYRIKLDANNHLDLIVDEANLLGTVKWERVPVELRPTSGDPYYTAHVRHQDPKDCSFANQPPTANAGGPYKANLGSPVVFDGSKSSDPDDFLSFAWNFGDGNSGSGIVPSHTYTKAGTYTVTLTVSENRPSDGHPLQTAPASTTVKINTPPVANPGGPYTGTAGNPVTFDGSGSSDADKDPLTYTWDFGDGQSGTKVSPTHAYAKAGTYTVKLTVDDGQGGTNSATTTATIK